MVVGTIAAIIQGAMMPAFIILFGEVTCCSSFAASLPVSLIIGCACCFHQLLDSFNPDDSDSLTSHVELLVRILFGVGLGSFLIGYIQVSTWVLSSQSQATTMRVAYFRALLRQEMSWYDRHASGELTTQIAESLPKIQAAIGDKVEFDVFG
jgi:ABC-type multidrug transport system fused ATPase/permease subunit